MWVQLTHHNRTTTTQQHHRNTPYHQRRHTAPHTPPPLHPYFTTPCAHRTVSYTAFLSFHLWLVCRNYTTIEFCEKRGADDSR